MLKFLTSLTFLYAFVIVLLLLYGWYYYKNFIKNGYQQRRFPVVFFLTGLACFSFLYSNINAPLSLKTFSNLDHHFIRHDGFSVSGSIELGRTDTVNYKGNAFNRFLINKQSKQLQLISTYSEEPFYTSSGNSYKLLSVNYPAANHTIQYKIDSISVSIKAIADSSFELRVNDNVVARTPKVIKKGIDSWNIFKDDIDFINTAWYTNEQLLASLRNI